MTAHGTATDPQGGPGEGGPGAGDPGADASGAGEPEAIPVLERVATEAEDGVRLDVAVAGWLAEPRARAQERIAAGEVRVGAIVAAKSRSLRPGDRVVVAPPPQPPALDLAGAPEVAVRWEDEHLLVVAKPAGLVVHPGSGTARRDRVEATLVDVLVDMGVALAPSDDPVRPGIVHRLDRGTSGVLAVAKTPAAQEGLQALFKRHAAVREYHALTDGVPDPPSATVDAPIARSASARTRFAVNASGRRAVSHYDVLEDFGRVAFVRVRLETGRTHQVRVHLSAVGHPVCGDRSYGADPALAAEIGMSRPALHARRLAFDHPVTGERIEVTEPLADDIAAALERLRALP